MGMDKPQRHTKRMGSQDRLRRWYQTPKRKEKEKKEKSSEIAVFAWKVYLKILIKAHLKMYHGPHRLAIISRKNSISSAAMSGDVIRKLLSSAGIRPSGLRPPYQTSLWSMTQKLGR